MKSCKTITGTVVIEIEKGMGLGEVHEVFVDEGVNLTFVIKSKQSEQPFALLSSKNIQGIGDFAVMVENSSVFQKLSTAPETAIFPCASKARCLSRRRKS